MSDHPQVFLSGDPEPGMEVRAVLDKEGRVWPRVGDTDQWLCSGGEEWSWRYILAFAPLVACEPLPDYQIAVTEDKRRREVT